MSSREPGRVDEDRIIQVEDQGRVLETAGIEVSTHLWYVWTEIAIEHEWLAKRARRLFQADRTVVAPLEDEMKGSLVAVTGVTHCLDALQNEVAALGVLSDVTVARWTKGKPKAHTAVFQTLRETFRSPKLTPQMETRLHELYELRNEVVHHRPTFGEIVEHPALGMPTTPATARYTVERATQAVDLLFGILSAIAAERDDQPGAARAWASTWRSSIGELISGRDVESRWIGH